MHSQPLHWGDRDGLIIDMPTLSYPHLKLKKIHIYTSALVSQN